MFVAVRDLRFAKGRFALMGGVIALVTVLIVLLTGLANGLVDDGISGLRNLPASHVAFQPGSEATFSRSVVEASVWEELGDSVDVSVEPIGATFLNGKTTDGNAVDLVMFGVEVDSSLLPDVIEGDSLSSGSPGVIISTKLANAGVEIGDVIALRGVTAQQINVVGIADAGSYGHVSVVFAPLEIWRTVSFGPAAADLPFASAVTLRVGSGVDLDAIEKELGIEILTKEAAYAGSPGFSAEQSTMTLIRAFLYVIVALVVGAFFSIWTVQRTREIGLLKALGATNRYVMQDALSQVFVVLVSATVVGLLVGVVLATVIGSGDVPFSLSLGSLVSTMALLIGLGALGALVALRRITSVDPIISLGEYR